MRASELVKAQEPAAMLAMMRGDATILWLRDLARCLAATQAAVEALAAEAGTGPARRIRAILDREEGT